MCMCRYGLGGIIMIDPELEEKYRKEKQITDENYEKAISSLKNYFKRLYDNAGMDWTEDDDKEIEFITNTIMIKTISIYGEFQIEQFKNKEK